MLSKNKHSSRLISLLKICTVPFSRKFSPAFLRKQKVLSCNLTNLRSGVPLFTPRKKIGTPAGANRKEIFWARKFPENSKTVKFPRCDPLKCEPFWEENKGNESPGEEKLGIARAPSIHWKLPKVSKRRKMVWKLNVLEEFQKIRNCLIFDMRTDQAKISEIRRGISNEMEILGEKISKTWVYTSRSCSLFPEFRKMLFHLLLEISGYSNRNFWSNGKRKWTPDIQVSTSVASLSCHEKLE